MTHAGSWYPGTENALLKEMNNLFTDDKFGPGEEPHTQNLEKRTIIGGLCPHAGIRFSGYCAAHTYLNLFKERIPDTIVILGNIHNRYNDIAIFEKGEWETPLGNLEVDDELVQVILNKSEIIQLDNSAFTGDYEAEHNIEIQLPFIKYCMKESNLKIVPIKLGYKTYHNYKLCEEVASDLSESINSYNKDVVIVASSDMQHEEVLNLKKLEKFKSRDKDVINAFEELNAEKLMNIASNLTVCGPQTITTLLLTCKILNATSGKLLKYYTSVDKGGFGYCVGYFSGVISL